MACRCSRTVSYVVVGRCCLSRRLFRRFFLSPSLALSSSLFVSVSLSSSLLLPKSIESRPLCTRVGTDVVYRSLSLALDPTNRLIKRVEIRALRKARGTSCVRVCVLEVSVLVSPDENCVLSSYSTRLLLSLPWILPQRACQRRRTSSIRSDRTSEPRT